MRTPHSPQRPSGAMLNNMAQTVTDDTESLNRYFQDLKKFEQNLTQGPLAEVLKSAPVQRLKCISFIPEFCLSEIQLLSYSRYEHSIGVAYLAASCAETLGLNARERDVLILAGIIHDIGHTPLSHATEQFLLETKRRYHHAQGLIVAETLKGKVNTALDPTIDSAIDLLQVSKSNKLSPLIRGVFSADNLDGILRSCLIFDLPIFDPSEVLSGIRMVNERVAFADSGDLIYRERVIQLTRQIYQGKLRSNYVLASEAMLVRALQLACGEDPSIVDGLQEWGDNFLIESLSSHIQSSELIALLQAKKPFVALVDIYPELAHRVLMQGKQTRRTDFEARRGLEQQVADKLEIDRQDVILYYTARKTIQTRPAQLELPLGDSTGAPGAENAPLLTPIDALHSKHVLRGDAVHIFVKPFLSQPSVSL